MSEESELLAVRRAKLERLRADGVDPFPHEYPGVGPIVAIHDAHALLPDGTDTEDRYRVAGRLHARRGQGKMAFLDLDDRSGRIQLQAKADGGLMAGLKRSALGGASFFVTTYTAPQDGGWVDVAGVLPGDVVDVPIAPDRPFFLGRSNWIANSAGVQIDTQWGGMANLFGGEGGFGFRATGQGQALVSGHGAIDFFDLQPGETVTIDTGHVVAYDLNTGEQKWKAAADMPGYASPAMMSIGGMKLIIAGEA